MDGINLRDVRPSVNNPRSNFDLSFKRMFTSKFGELFPHLVLPIMPGDKISLSSQHILRMAPFVSQCFQHYVVAMHYYFVPNSLLWPEFDAFMADGWDGQSIIPHPYIGLGMLTSNGHSHWSDINLFSAMDVPMGYILTADTNDSSSNSYVHKVNALPFAAYLRCYLDWHIGTDTALNQILQEVMAQQRLLQNGDNTAALTTLYAKVRSGNPDRIVNFQNDDLHDMWRTLPCLYPLDYFTGARSNPQLGPVMTIPLSLVSTDSDGTQTFQLTEGPAISNASNNIYGVRTAGSDKITFKPASAATTGITINGEIFNNKATIYDFYSAARLAELFAIYGYSGFTPSDALAAEFGVKNPDSRMHKSEHLFSDYFDFNCGEVFSNDVQYQPKPSEDASSLVPGSATAIGKSDGISRGFSREFTQFGYLIGMYCVYPEASYQQGIPRHMLMSDRFDYPHPKFANLAMESIKLQEVYCSSHDDFAYNNDFCYLPPYSHYKVGVNRVNAQLTESLSYMTAGRKFGSAPQFDEQFLRVLPENNQLNRTFNVTTNFDYDQPLFTDIKLNINANRQLPKFGLFNI